MERLKESAEWEELTALERVQCANDLFSKLYEAEVKTAMRETLPPPPDTHREGVEAARDIAAAVTRQSEAIHDALAAPIREGGYTLD